MGFETLDAAINTPLAYLVAEEVAFDNEELSDEAAMAIVLGDVDTAISFVQSKGLPIDWDQVRRFIPGLRQTTNVARHRCCPSQPVDAFDS